MKDSSLAKSNQDTRRLTWKEIVLKYQRPALGPGLWQVVNTLVPYAALWYLMYLSIAFSWWLALPLGLLAGGFLGRGFIISHDCGHGSFFPSQKANDLLGFVTGVLTFVPYYHWRWEHAVHHATSGDLDRRGTGDIWTLTVQEYLEASRWSRFAYRLARNPFILFVIAPLYLFLIRHRFPSAKANKAERHSVYWMNLAILGMCTVMSLVFGFKTYLLLQLIITGIASAAGVWLFYVQHQFDGVYWERGANWDYTKA